MLSGSRGNLSLNTTTSTYLCHLSPLLHSTIPNTPPAAHPLLWKRHQSRGLETVWINLRYAGMRKGFYAPFRNKQSS